MKLSTVARGPPVVEGDDLDDEDPVGCDGDVPTDEGDDMSLRDGAYKGNQNERPKGHKDRRPK